MCDMKLKLQICAMYYSLLRKGLTEWEAIIKISEQIPIKYVFDSLGINEDKIRIKID